MSQPIDGQFLLWDEALPTGTRMLSWKMRNGSTVLSVSISEPLADGSCRSRWQTSMGPNTFDVDTMYHSNAAHCDEFVQGVLYRHEQSGWTLETGPAIIIAGNDR